MGRRNASIGRQVARGLAIVAGLVVLYLLAGLIGGAIPANRDWRPPAAGITVFVETNGVHTGFVVPKYADGVDWRPLARPEHLRDPRYAAYDHLAIGWGERAFYLGTPTWWDVKPATVLAAAIGSRDTLVHVDHVPRPVPSGDVRAITLTPDQYRRLAAHIAESVAPNARSVPGYGDYDAFYEGTGRYSAVTTCNAWTGAGLRRAGVRTGAWTPLAATVMWWL